MRFRHVLSQKVCPLAHQKKASFVQIDKYLELWGCVVGRKGGGIHFKRQGKRITNVICRCVRQSYPKWQPIQVRRLVNLKLPQLFWIVSVRNLQFLLLLSFMNTLQIRYNSRQGSLLNILNPSSLPPTYFFINR